MKIDSIKLKNFRGYENETVVCLDDLTVFVGKNDVGKSTILEALDIFFNDGKGVVKIEKLDVNTKAIANSDQEIVISVCFSDLPQEVILDAAAKTNLAEEYLLNTEGKLEVIKKYRNGGVPKVFIKANHPTSNKCSDLLLKKNSELKGIIKQESVVCNDLTVNSCMRKNIWKYFEDDLCLQEIEIDVTKEDAKRIWEQLVEYLPLYSLFQSDRKNSDTDSEVQDPLKEAVKQILSESNIQSKLEEISKIVMERIQEVSSRTLEKLREMDEDIADTLNPVMPATSSLKWSDVFKNVSITGDEDIPINKRGSGVRRLILLNFFRAEAERRARDINSVDVIYAIEEPETSQHTNNQSKLIDALKTLSSTNGTQIILTTHSPTIVKNLDFSNLRLIKNVDGGKEVHNVLPGQLHYPSLNEVNFLAFDETTAEYHNELYGFIELQGWLNEYKDSKPLRKYMKQKQNGNLSELSLTLTEYIRHQIHHPENQNNPKYTHAELKQSIEQMREFIEENDSIK